MDRKIKCPDCEMELDLDQYITRPNRVREDLYKHPHSDDCLTIYIKIVRRN